MRRLVIEIASMQIQKQNVNHEAISAVASRPKSRHKFLPRGETGVFCFERSESIDRLERTAAMTQRPIATAFAIASGEILLSGSHALGIGGAIQFEQRMISQTAVERALFNRSKAEDRVNDLVEWLNDPGRIGVERSLQMSFHDVDVSSEKFFASDGAPASDHRLYLRLKIVCSNEVEKAIGIDGGVYYHQRAEIQSRRAEFLLVADNELGGRTIVFGSAEAIMTMLRRRNVLN